MQVFCILRFFFDLPKSKKNRKNWAFLKIFRSFFKKIRKNRNFSIAKNQKKIKECKKIAFSDFYCKKRPKKGGRVEEEVVALRKIDCSSSELLKTCSFKTKSEVH